MEKKFINLNFDKNFKKKICIGIDASNIRAGGGVTHLTELLKFKDFEKLNINKIVVWSGQETIKLLKKNKIISLRKSTSFKSSIIKRIFWQIFILSKEIKKEKCDILFSPGGFYLGNFNPIVAMSQNLLPFSWREIIRFGVSLKTLRLYLLRISQTYTFNRANGIIFLSKFALKTVKKVTGNLKGSVILIPHGINEKFINLPRKQLNISSYSIKNNYKILYVSTISLYKHQWNVIEAVAKLRNKYGWPLELNIVGSVGDSLAIKKLKNSIALWDPERKWVKFNGPVSHELINKVYKKADLGIFASSCENMPNILIEMMAMGLPVACSNKGPMMEFLRQYGSYFNPESPKEIFHSLKNLIKNPKLRKKNSKNSYKIAKKYSWNQSSKATFKFLKNIE